MIIEDIQLTAHLASPNSQRSAKSESKLSSSPSLTAHFSLSEFTRSATAERLGIDNTPPQEAIDNLIALCQNVLEPLRRHVGQPVVISSGYRCKALNKKVGGVRNSQHMTGEAADIQPPSIPRGGSSEAVLKEWFLWIKDNCQFDQLILEHTRSGKYWLHVSYSTRHNRQCVISNILKK